MNILGITVGELSTAAIMVDGRIVAACSEERFTRAKNDERFPVRSIQYCLDEAGITSADVDLVGIAGTQLNFTHLLTRTYSSFSIQDHVREQREFWYPKFYRPDELKEWTDVFSDKLDVTQWPGTLEQLLPRKGKPAIPNPWEKFHELLHEGLQRDFGIPKSKVIHVDHHTCHAAYAYWGSPFRGEPTLVITADAWGDDVSATLGKATEGGIERLHTVSHTEFMLARLYRYITLVLGMKPNEHEYKVMGLAAYAKPEMLAGPYEVFARTMSVDGLGFKWAERPTDLYFYFRDRLEGYRFDGIAGGLQRYTEEILREWVSNALRRTGLRRFVFSGGIAMNVKAHMVLHEIPEVADIFVCGSGSDESLALGVCYHLMEQHCRSAKSSLDVIQPHPMYLGPSFTPQDVRQWSARRPISSQYDIEEGVSPARVAEHLAAGHVIGRSVGRMEFGQRALGNRSIIADPRNRAMIEKINRKIKNRDFWMPFAPSILAERQHDYISNPKQIRAPFMTIGFDSTALARDELPATLHPADHSLRPQVLEKQTNPWYHELLSAFQNLTGVGGVLNTSFNLHGEPIVCSPDDALHVFESSEIDMILLEDVLIKKRNVEASAFSTR